MPPGRSPAKRSPPKKSKAVGGTSIITLSDSDDEARKKSTSKGGGREINSAVAKKMRGHVQVTPNKKAAVTQKKEKDGDDDFEMYDDEQDEDDDDDDDDDDEAEYKPKATITAASSSKGKLPAKRKSNAVASGSSSSSDDDASFSGVKSKTTTSHSQANSKKPKAAVVKPAIKEPPSKKPKIENSSSNTDLKKTDEPEKPKFKWRPKANAGPVAPGSKDIPAGADNCLAGLTFVFTGELSSLSREQGQDLAKRYGGKVTSAPSSKTSYVVLGADAGPKKLEMIAKHHLKTLDEDGFLALIGSRPSGKSDPKVIEQQKKEQEKIQVTAKSMGLAKDAPEHMNQLWTVKYAPQRLTEICGNKSMVEKLDRWLSVWPKSLETNFKRPGPDAMGIYRAVLISGAPGIGKTTAAHLVAKLQGYNILELNASDTRSKKLLESSFKSTVENKTLSGFFSNPLHQAGEGLGVNSKSIIIMDEVDGMSAGDRGGIGALNNLIKHTKVPIIAICNDRSSPKMKPLQGTCFPMTFKRPSAPEIRARMMSVAFKEGMKVDGTVMDQLVAGSQSDIRQIVNMLSTWKLGAKSMDFDEGKRMVKMNEKNTIQTPWTLYSKLFNPASFSAQHGLSLNEKLEAYFGDHSIMPLFVQENYIKGTFSKANSYTGRDKDLKNLELIAKASEAISDADLVDAMIHGGQQQWSLMPVHGIFSCVRPGFFCHGMGGGFPAFPAWLGKNSSQGKLQRLLGEVQIRMRLRVSGDRREIRQSYIPTLFPMLVLPLQQRGGAGIEEVIELMDDYYLTKEDWDAIVELGVGDGFDQTAALQAINSAVKSAFTRQYNKTDHPVPFYKPTDSFGKVRKIAAVGEVPDLEDALVEEEEGEEEDAVVGDDSGEDEDISKDKLIKQKKSSSAKSGGKATISVVKGKGATKSSTKKK